MNNFNYQILHLEQHKNFAFKHSNDYSFAKQTIFVPIVLAEIHKVAIELPMFFVANENNATEVNEVTIEVGRLAMINPEQLQFILGVLIENTIMEDAKINFNEIPVEMECYDCNLNGEDILDDSDHYAPLVK